jgi:hypothetical protein
MESEWLKDFKGVILLNPYLRPFLLAIVCKNNLSDTFYPVFQVSFLGICSVFRTLFFKFRFSPSGCLVTP